MQICPVGQGPGGPGPVGSTARQASRKPRAAAGKSCGIAGASVAQRAASNTPEVSEAKKGGDPRGWGSKSGTPLPLFSEIVGGNGAAVTVVHC